jgi:hypothetical protein
VEFIKVNDKLTSVLRS